MQLAIIANEELKDEILSAGIHENCKIDWINAGDDPPLQADAVIDLLFEPNNYDSSRLKTILEKPIIVGSVNRTISEIDFPVVRINGWPGFLKRGIVEASCSDNHDKRDIEEIFSLLNRKVEWIPDIKGFISPRVVSMIINEAYFSLEENLSTKNEIDTAMKLGTNYPYGPFEWGKKIGLKNIVALLTSLSKTETRYIPSALLIKESGEE
jgi:3-hydroxybutyryl-CoA dehydrogenase